MGKMLIAGNWKMNGLRGDGLPLATGVAKRAAAGLPTGVEVLVCPPFTLLQGVGEALAGAPVALGAQDCHRETAGAYTGDISAPMLSDLGCSYAIVGHSERRAYHGESDADVRAKAVAVLAGGLTPIVCIGESEAEREAGQALAVIGRQLAGGVPDDVPLDRLVVAYEPIWAIGTGRTATPADVAEVHGEMRRLLVARFGEGARAVRLLYGGSVKPANARELLATRDVDGALVGGASLNTDDFWGIVESCP